MQNADIKIQFAEERRYINKPLQNERNDLSPAAEIKKEKEGPEGFSLMLLKFHFNSKTCNTS